MNRFASSLRRSCGAALMCLSLASAAAIGAATPAMAQEEEEEGDRQFSTAIGELVLEAEDQAGNDNFQGAIQTLDEALAEGPSEFERFVIHQLRAQNYVSMDRMDLAIPEFEGALATSIPNEEERAALSVNLGQLLIAEDRVMEGVELLERHIERTGTQPSETVLMMLAQALAQEGYAERALPYAEQAFEMVDPKERKHFDLLNFLYNDLNMPAEQADIIREMLNRWPDDKNLWNGWVSMLAQGDRTRDAFEVNKLMYVNGMLTTENDVLRLVDYYSFFEVPFRGAQILEREMNAGRVESSQRNTEKLINLWRQAREYDRAIPTLRQAAAAAPTGELYEQLCEAHYSEAEYEEAEEACQNAIQKGGLEEPGNDWVLIGNARYERGQRQAALEAFQRGLDYSHSRTTARGWIDFINGEIAAEEARIEFEEIVEREECIITIERIRRDDVLGARAGEIPERCRQYEAYVE